MTFNIDNFKEVSGPGNSQGGGQTYSVFSATDTIATMLASGYLNDLALTLNVRDFVFLSGADGAQIVQVDAVTTTTVSVRNVPDGSFDTIVEAGAVSLLTSITYIATVGAIAITLADGVVGQKKTLIMTVDGGTATLTPANFANGATLAFADVNDAVQLIFSPTIGWANVSLEGAVIA